MKRINIQELKNWIEPYLTVKGTHPKVDESLRNKNIIEFFKQITIPNIFESYAIILHSYWVYDLPLEKVRENELKGYDIENYEPEFPEENYKPISWKDFYEYKNLKFDLKKAIKENVEWSRPFKQMNNEIWPGEGVLDMKILKSISDIILQTYGEQSIEFYYIFLATKTWEDDEMYEGKLSELIEFLKNENNERTPSLLYEKNKNWAITSDTDLPFSIIGGKYDLISQIINKHKNEVYLIE